MKYILAIVISTLSFGSYASEKLVFEEGAELNQYVFQMRTQYNYSKSKGTALIEVSGDGPGICPGDNCIPDYFVNSHKVEGLYFDRNIGKRGAVLYDDGSGAVVCAYHRRVLGQKLTKNCRLELEEYSRGAYHVRLYIQR